MTKFFAMMLALMFLFAAPSFAADELCPDIPTANKNQPKDMAGVQADIERLTLCVERAQLLKQLDDVAKARADMLEKLKNPSSSTTTSLSVAPGSIPPLPISALPPLGNADTKNLKPGEVRIKGPADSPLGTTLASLVAPSWKVRKIWGQGAQMRAQLSDGHGVLVNVVKGDPLPDGGSVETVSVKGVAVSQNGKITDLGWDSVDSVATSNNPSGLPNAPQATP
jgi:hypothetical protein